MLHLTRTAGTKVNRSVGSPIGRRPGEVLLYAVASETTFRKVIRVDHTYRVSEIVGSSPDSIDQAIRNAIARASTTVRHLDWFEVTQIRGHIADGEVGHYQVGLKVGFRIEDGDDA